MSKWENGEICLEMENFDEEIEDLITGKMKEKIDEELSKRVPEPKKIKKIKYEKIRYVSTNRIIENVEGWKKQKIKSLLRTKKCSELMLIG